MAMKFSSYYFLYYIFWHYIRPVIKWFIHVYTGKSELERIIAGKQSRFAKIRAVEYSLMHSRSAELRDIPICPVQSVDSAIQLVAKVKNIGKTDLISLRPQLRQTLVPIMGYNQLAKEVEWVRQIPFDSTNLEHENLLLDLWNLLRPAVPLESRRTKDWQFLGFQGDDPATDFRGMGILGLQQLVYFSTRYNEQALRILQRSLHPQKGFPFAIVGIAITALIRDLLRREFLKTHFYNSVSGPPAMVHFHEIYCTVFCMFDELWERENPASVMEFSKVRAKLNEDLVDFLTRNDYATLRPLESAVE